MSLFKNSKKFNLFILGIFFINILQAIFTPILKDEAYYWRWAQNLDWGYFDHPPMVAFIIKLGTYLFPDALGIRFVTVLLNIAMIFVVWALVPDSHKKQKNTEWIFFSILLAMPFFHVYGFITTPDAPLLFFSALYLLALKKIDEKDNLKNVLFFGLSAALLIYTKYFGGIVILISILVKPNLLKKKATYIAGILSVFLLIPYIYWLYNNDFITLNYHLFQRKSIGYFRPKFVFGYLFGTIGVLNPGLVLILFYQMIKKKIPVNNNNTFMTRMFIGYLLFFFLYSFRSWIEAHWVAFATIPMTILLYNLCVSNSRIFKKVKYVAIISIILLFSARLAIALDLPLKTEFHKQGEKYFKSVQMISKHRKVIFINSYQNASKYSFYTGQKSFSINDIYYRKNQYDLWDFENEIKNKKVIIVGPKSTSFKDSVKLDTGDYIWYKKIDKFYFIGALKTDIKTLPKVFYSNEKKSLKLTINNPYDYNIVLNNKNNPYQIAFHFENKGFNRIVPLSVESPQNIKANLNSVIELNYALVNIQPGKYSLSIVIRDKYLYYRQISIKKEVEIRVGK
jgi:Dolichyl-phosphate-mannose-protein mannosyltransferase